MESQSIRAFEQAAVDYRHVVTLGQQFDVLIQSLHFLHLRRDTSVREHNAVPAEAIVCRPVSEIAAVGEKFLAVAVFGQKRLIDKVPNKASLVKRVPVFQFHIFMHSAYRIAHGMHILAADIRLPRIVLQILGNICRFGIHPALHIAGIIKLAVVKHALIMNQPGVVALAEIIRNIQNDFARIRFIAAGPDQDGGMVLVPFQHGNRAVHDNIMPFRLVSRNIPGRLDGAHLLPGTMRLQVHLIHYVHAIFIT
ncbi:hypothetical protein D3C81_702880 [compost metagenome]